MDPTDPLAAQESPTTPGVTSRFLNPGDPESRADPSTEQMAWWEVFGPTVAAQSLRPIAMRGA